MQLTVVEEGESVLVKEVYCDCKLACCPIEVGFHAMGLMSMNRSIKIGKELAYYLARVLVPSIISRDDEYLRLLGFSF